MSTTEERLMARARQLEHATELDRVTRDLAEMLPRVDAHLARLRSTVDTLSERRARALAYFERLAEGQAGPTAAVALLSDALDRLESDQ